MSGATRLNPLPHRSKPDNAHTLTRSLRRHLVAGVVAIGLLFGGVGGWAATTELSGAVIASGRLVVEGNVKKVQHQVGGIVAELLVREGQVVEAGEVVVRLDATITRSNLAAVATSLDQLHARKARLKTELDGLVKVETPLALHQRLSPEKAEAAMATERRLFRDRTAARDGQKARLREQTSQLREQISGLDVQQQAKTREIALIGKELEGQHRLFDMGLTSMNRVNSLDRDATRLEGERGQLVASIAATKGRIAEIELQLLQVDQTMRADVATELRDVETKESELVEEEVAALDQLKHIEVKAPIAGTVHQLSVHTIGGVVTPAETLMEIVPRESLLTVEARIRPQDIDQVAPGQAATLKFTAFNRNTTPDLKGSVLWVAADLETDDRTGISFYRASISIPASELDLIQGRKLLAGMPVEAFVRTDDRTVVSYLIKPIRDHAARVFRHD
ncbi:HlyD family type I secretion periplasmic adaptor subunit (plasmid) [Rhizobium leguminosarum bv. viciae 248]|uniref:HlyD family type I secretion periplasmic adaptor subunit n=1 Tax=Rhizobium leguminosarum TaxID=384 RepID=UPI00035F4614|nr:HlyD family type I secretion periplasmic adaptor subunit [Rhizobium leguminosarum]MCA2410805.1 HlyD family type I secretion periplasmic adaptor subunit [Rhizobium leguminosarum]QHW29328.1 HlyD family type I secretion periplasmic adaptor subunit [Rhizobium leguminosarum bv. viciae 248]